MQHHHFLFAIDSELQMQIYLLSTVSLGITKPANQSENDSSFHSCVLTFGDTPFGLHFNDILHLYIQTL